MSKNFLVIVGSSKLIQIYSFPKPLLYTIIFATLKQFWLFLGGVGGGRGGRRRRQKAQIIVLQLFLVRNVIYKQAPSFHFPRNWRKTLFNDWRMIAPPKKKKEIFWKYFSPKNSSITGGWLASMAPLSYICASNHNLFHSIGLNSPSGQLCFLWFSLKRTISHMMRRV